MGIFDKVKTMFGNGNVDKLKDQAATVKGQVDGLVDQYGEKLPDSVRNGYSAVSDKVDSVLPGDADTATEADLADGAAAGAADPADNAQD